MKKEYVVAVKKLETHDGFQWCAEFPDVEGCGGGGETAEEAVREAYENLEFHLESLREMGIEVPEPVFMQNEDYSGKTVVRMGKSLHKKVAECAEADGISQNTFIVEAIAEKVGSTSTTNKLVQVVTSITEKMYESFKMSKTYSTRNANYSMAQYHYTNLEA